MIYLLTFLHIYKSFYASIFTCFTTYVFLYSDSSIRSIIQYIDWVCVYLLTDIFSYLTFNLSIRFCHCISYFLLNYLLIGSYSIYAGQDICFHWCFLCLQRTHRFIEKLGLRKFRKVLDENWVKVGLFPLNWSGKQLTYE